MQCTLLVADDNPIECDTVVLFLKRLYPEAVIITCKDGFEVLEELQNGKVDVVFSDIEMPGLDGLNLIKSLPEPPPFVFITSYADYAVESFNVDAIDFMVKPVTFARIAKASQKAFEYISLRASHSSSSTDNELVRTEQQAVDHFFIRENGGFTRIYYADVAYVESMGDFSKIFKAEGQQHIVLSSLKNLENQLPDQLFKRVHRQYIVNLNQLQSIMRGEVVLKNKMSIPLSASFHQDVTAAFVIQDPIKRN